MKFVVRLRRLYFMGGYCSGKTAISGRKFADCNPHRGRYTCQWLSNRARAAPIRTIADGRRVFKTEKRK